MRHQNHSFLEPSAVRNLEKLLGGYTTHKELQGYSSKPRQYVCRRKGESLMAQTQHGATLEEVGLELGVTRERVCQIEKAALDKCRKWCDRNWYKVEDLVRYL